MDATDQGIGRLATQIAAYLLGKHKPTFTPGVGMGDFVVVINASRLQITGKRLDEKNYYHHSGYPGGLKTDQSARPDEKSPGPCDPRGCVGHAPAQSSSVAS